MTKQQRKALVQAANRRAERDGEPWLVVDRDDEFLVMDQRDGRIVERYRDHQAMSEAFGLLGSVDLSVGVAS